MESKQQERYVRWQNYRISQFSFSINLFLGFAIASLGYAINLKLENKPHGFIPLDCIIIWYSVSAAFGCIATVSRLLDFRYTARKIKDNDELNKNIAKHLGIISWSAFWVQIVAYIIGVFLFIKGVLFF